MDADTHGCRYTWMVGSSEPVESNDPARCLYLHIEVASVSEWERVWEQGEHGRERVWAN